MSTGTARVPDAEHRRGVPSADGDRATTRVVLVSIVATLAVAWSLVLAFAFTAQNGKDLASGRGWLLTFLAALVPGLLAAWAVHLVSSTAEGTPTPYAVLAPICVVLMMCGVAIVATFGGRAHDDRQATIAAACTARDVDVLRAFAAYGGQFGGPEGTADGTCEAQVILPGEDAQSLVAALTGTMTADGWSTHDATWDERAFTRGADVVRVTHVRSSEGSTAIRFTVVDPG